MSRNFQCVNILALIIPDTVIIYSLNAILLIWFGTRFVYHFLMARQTPTSAKWRAPHVQRTLDHSPRGINCLTLGGVIDWRDLWRTMWKWDNRTQIDCKMDRANNVSSLLLDCSISAVNGAIENTPIIKISTCMIAREKRPALMVDRRCKLTLADPALSPKIVTLLRSPPKADR